MFNLNNKLQKNKSQWRLNNQNYKLNQTKSDFYNSEYDTPGSVWATVNKLYTDAIAYMQNELAHDNKTREEKGLEEPMNRKMNHSYYISLPNIHHRCNHCHLLH